MREARPVSQGFANLMAWGSSFAFPGTWVDWIVLPLLAAAYEEHDEAEDEHDGSPGEIEVDAHGFFVDVCGVAGEEAVEAHEAADEQEDEAEGDADVESHFSYPFSVIRSQLYSVTLRFRSVAFL